MVHPTTETLPCPPSGHFYYHRVVFTPRTLNNRHPVISGQHPWWRALNGWLLYPVMMLSAGLVVWSQTSVQYRRAMIKKNRCFLCDNHDGLQTRYKKNNQLHCNHIWSHNYLYYLLLTGLPVCPVAISYSQPLLRLEAKLCSNTGARW